MVVITLTLLMLSLMAGLFASFLAHDEFQAVQFIPLVVLPQIFLSDLIWSIDRFPLIFRVISLLLPLTHANIAMRRVLLQNQSVWAAWPQLGVLILMDTALACGLMLAARRSSRTD